MKITIFKATTSKNQSKNRISGPDHFLTAAYSVCPKCSKLSIFTSKLVIWTNLVSVRGLLVDSSSPELLVLFLKLEK